MNSLKSGFYSFFLFTWLATSGLFSGQLLKEEFQKPSEQLMKREGKLFIEKKLKRIQGIENYFLFFEDISEREFWGHIGYHGACQGYRIYQDIIRFVIEEILEISIRRDFHFLRIPGDQDLFLETSFEFFNYWKFEVNNKSDIRKKQLLSLNYSLYSNYDVPGSCSLSFFVDGRSITPLDFCNCLEPFFKALGISPIVVKTLFKCAKKHLYKKEGILLRIFVEDDPLAYELVDAQSYPSKGRGIRDGIKLLSDDYATLMTQDYLEKKVNISPQFCLVINNRTTLNPRSWISIERFDTYSDEELSLYEQEMRSLIKACLFDQDKASNYRRHLLNLW